VAPRSKLLLAAPLSLVCWAAPAVAHPEWSPLRVNRYTKVILAGPGRVQLVYTVLYGDGPGLAVRKAADLDADGHVSPSEKIALGALTQTAVRGGLHLTLDGHEALPALDGVDVGLAGDEVAPDPLSVDVRYHLDAPAGVEHELVIDDHVEVPSEGDTEVVVDAPGPTELRAAFHGRPDPSRREPLFAFRGPRFSTLEDRRVTVRFLARAGHTNARRVRELAVVLVGVLGAAATALVLRRQRRLKG
jgi:hypothetical protein